MTCRSESVLLPPREFSRHGLAVLEKPGKKNKAGARTYHNALSWSRRLFPQERTAYRPKHLLWSQKTPACGAAPAGAGPTGPRLAAVGVEVGRGDQHKVSTGPTLSDSRPSDSSDSSDSSDHTRLHWHSWQRDDRRPEAAEARARLLRGSHAHGRKMQKERGDSCCCEGQGFCGGDGQLPGCFLFGFAAGTLSEPPTNSKVLR